MPEQVSILRNTTMCFCGKRPKNAGLRSTNDPRVSVCIISWPPLHSPRFLHLTPRPVFLGQFPTCNYARADKIQSSTYFISSRAHLSYLSKNLMPPSPICLKTWTNSQLSWKVQGHNHPSSILKEYNLKLRKSSQMYLFTLTKTSCSFRIANCHLPKKMQLVRIFLLWWRTPVLTGAMV